MTIEIVAIADHPELIPGVARWLWEEWGRAEGRTLETIAAGLGARTARTGPEQCVVLLDGGVPAATASLVHADLDARPDLTPWLASVYVDAPFRGRGHSVRLVRAVERLAADTVPTLWLQTSAAAGLYARTGWVPAGNGIDPGVPVVIMRRDLAAARRLSPAAPPPAAAGR
jgi:GNAT superfamily N-acetyltransferase